MKDCTTCKYGYEDERLGIPMCHHPKRFSEDCVNFNMHEEKETEESEKPINPEDAIKELDEKIALVKQRGTWDGVDVDKYMDEVRGRESEKPVPNDLEEAAVDIADALLAKPKDYALSAKADYWNGAHDGIIAGAKWQAAHTPLPEDTVLFQKGVEEGKRLMMEEAVEGEVMTNGFYPYEPRIVAPYPDCPYNFGDKVRVIVIPNTDKK